MDGVQEPDGGHHDGVSVPLGVLVVGFKPKQIKNVPVQTQSQEIRTAGRRRSTNENGNAAISGHGYRGDMKNCAKIFYQFWTKRERRGTTSSTCQV